MDFRGNAKYDTWAKQLEDEQFQVDGPTVKNKVYAIQRVAHGLLRKHSELFKVSKKSGEDSEGLMNRVVGLKDAITRDAPWFDVFFTYFKNDRRYNPSSHCCGLSDGEIDEDDIPQSSSGLKRRMEGTEEAVAMKTPRLSVLEIAEVPPSESGNELLPDSKAFDSPQIGKAISSRKLKKKESLEDVLHPALEREEKQIHFLTQHLSDMKWLMLLAERNNAEDRVRQLMEQLDLIKRSQTTDTTLGSQDLFQKRIETLEKQLERAMVTESLLAKKLDEKSGANDLENSQTTGSSSLQAMTL